MVERSYLQDARRQLGKYQELADRAVDQTGDDHFFATLDDECNSIALIMKHVTGNMRSRWTDFLASDGEKPDRRRDSEFVLEDGDTRENITARWNGAWILTLSTIDGLGEGDLARVVTIRGEPHMVLEAINRQLMHYSYHVGLRDTLLTLAAIIGLAPPTANTQERSLSSVAPPGRHRLRNHRRRADCARSHGGFSRVAYIEVVVTWEVFTVMSIQTY